MVILNLSLQYAISPCNPTWLLWCVMSAFIQFHRILQDKTKRFPKFIYFRTWVKLMYLKGVRGKRVVLVSYWQVYQSGPKNSQFDSIELQDVTHPGVFIIFIINKCGCVVSANHRQGGKVRAALVSGRPSFRHFASAGIPEDACELLTFYLAF